MLDSSLITLQLQHHRPPLLCPAATYRDKEGHIEVREGHIEDNEGHVEVREGLFWCTPQHVYVRISPLSIVTSHIVDDKTCSHMQQTSCSIADESTNV
jgi:hypothetical protein